MGWQSLMPVSTTYGGVAMETAVWLGSCRLIKQRVRGSQQLKRHLKTEYGGIWWPSRPSEPNCWLLWQQTMTWRVHMLWCHCAGINTSSCRRKSLRQSKDFSNPDLTFSCSQVEEAEQNMHKTAYSTAMCQFEYNKMWLGLQKTPSRDSWHAESQPLVFVVHDAILYPNHVTLCCKLSQWKLGEWKVNNWWG